MFSVKLCKTTSEAPKVIEINAISMNRIIGHTLCLFRQ